MLDAIEERIKQDDETTAATQLMKMLGECGFKILTESLEDTPSYLIRIFSMIHWGTAIERNCSDKRANSDTSTLWFSVRCDTLTIHILNNIIAVNR